MGSSPWPFLNEEFDSIVCLQVMEHAQDLPLLVSEMRRVLKHRGQLIITVPFIFNEHGIPYDFRRFSKYGVQQPFNDYELLDCRNQGGIGTVIGTLCLNWIETELNRHTLSRFIKAAAFPLWILLTVGINACGCALDWIDTTGNFYTSVLIRLKKRRDFFGEAAALRTPYPYRLIANGKHSPRAEFILALHDSRKG